MMGPVLGAGIFGRGITLWSILLTNQRKALGPFIKGDNNNLRPRLQ